MKLFYPFVVNTHTNKSDLKLFDKMEVNTQHTEIKKKMMTHRPTKHIQMFLVASF